MPSKIISWEGHMTNTMDLYVTQQKTETGIRRNLILKNIKNSDGSPIEAFFDMIGVDDAPTPIILDGFVMGIIFYAMETEQNIRVHGAMTKMALRNLDTFQEAWCLWKEKYKKVSITPDILYEQSEAAQKNEAIAAFSGGVDSIFTVLRHTKLLNDAAYPLNKELLMVHGFDVPLSRPDQLQELKDRTLPFTEDLNLNINILKTNLKELNIQDWEDSHMALIACCLSCYSHIFKYGLVGSTEPYDKLILPWGSNPVTDPLLSGSSFSLVHDGAAFSRTKKVLEISKHPLAMKVAKVCYDGNETQKNCGKCEKCLRTWMNFLAVGVPDPSCFETPPSANDIRSIPIRNDVHYGEIQSIIDYAKKNNKESEEWFVQVQKLAHKYEKGGYLFKLSCSLKYKMLRASRVWYMIKEGRWQDLYTKVQKNTPLLKRVLPQNINKHL